jgi:hypothetical protein
MALRMCQSRIWYFTQIRIQVESMAGTHLCPKLNYGSQFDEFYETHNNLMLLAGDFAIFNLSKVLKDCAKCW